MNEEEWLNEWYPLITKTLELSPEEDLASAVLLDSLIPSPATVDVARQAIAGNTCTVFGAGPSLERTFSRVRLTDIVSVASDGAARLFMERGLEPPDFLVTDLDGGDDVILWCARRSVLIIHAHGDNAAALRRLTPLLVSTGAKIIPTTQTAATGKLSNFFGFTDGDRAAWFCHAMGAKRIILVGMDFGRRIGRFSKSEPHADKTRKLKKLSIGERLIQRLAAEADVCTIRGSRKIPGIPSCNLASSCP